MEDKTASAYPALAKSAGFWSDLGQGAYNVGGMLYGGAKATVGTAAGGLGEILSAPLAATDALGLTNDRYTIARAGLNSVWGDVAASGKDVIRPFGGAALVGGPGMMGDSNNKLRMQKHTDDLRKGPGVFGMSGDTAAAVMNTADNIGYGATNVAALGGLGVGAGLPGTASLASPAGINIPTAAKLYGMAYTPYLASEGAGLAADWLGGDPEHFQMPRTPADGNAWNLDPFVGFNENRKANKRLTEYEASSKKTWAINDKWYSPDNEQFASALRANIAYRDPKLFDQLSSEDENLRQIAEQTLNRRYFEAIHHAEESGLNPAEYMREVYDMHAADTAGEPAADAPGKVEAEAPKEIVKAPTPEPDKLTPSGDESKGLSSFQKITDMLGGLGQAGASKIGIGDWYGKLSPTAQAAIPALLGAGGLGLGGYALYKLLAGGDDEEEEEEGRRLDPKIASAYPALTKAAFWPFSSKPEWKPPAYPDYSEFSDRGDYDGFDTAEEEYIKQMRKYLGSQNYTDIRESYGGPWTMRGPNKKYYASYVDEPLVTEPAPPQLMKKMLGVNTPEEYESQFENLEPDWDDLNAQSRRSKLKTEADVRKYMQNWINRHEKDPDFKEVSWEDLEEDLPLRWGSDAFQPDYLGDDLHDDISNRLRDPEQSAEAMNELISKLNLEKQSSTIASAYPALTKAASGPDWLSSLRAYLPDVKVKPGKWDVATLPNDNPLYKGLKPLPAVAPVPNDPRKSIRNVGTAISSFTGRQNKNYAKPE